uniref:Uncharacterized protein n=1 Tax=Candidatus Kentrum sp. FW TaxID=2126338 RepID=A0A450TCR4_9GAMM|nr:MAG: hypothetical protein BECKFW1821A_GA0114235_11773 [Candidatus Kentron sp. FW]
MVYSFELQTAAELFAATEDQFRHYLADGLSSRKAVTSAMLCWHIADWVYAESSTLQSRFPKLVDFHRYITAQCRSMKVMQDITNGTKHRDLRTPHAGIVKTEPRAGAFSPAFSRAFDRAELTIHLVDGSDTAFDIEFRNALTRQAGTKKVVQTCVAGVERSEPPEDSAISGGSLCSTPATLVQSFLCFLSRTFQVTD